MMRLFIYVCVCVCAISLLKIYNNIKKNNNIWIKSCPVAFISLRNESIYLLFVLYFYINLHNFETFLYIGKHIFNNEN